MAEEIAFENRWISKSQWLGILTLTLDRVTLHHLSTSTYIPNFIEIEETFHGRTYVRTDGRTDRRTLETHVIRSTLL